MRTPQQAAQAWVQGMQSATQKIQDGINATTVAPTQLAAQHLDKYLAGTQQAVASGKMAAKLNAVTLQQWQQATIAKVSRVGAGATTAQPKMQAHLQRFLPKVAAARATVKAMPSSTPADRIARMVAFATAMQGPVS